MPEKNPRLFDELVQAFDELKQWKEGKITLKTYTVEATPKPEVTPEIIRETREHLNLSRAVFAHELHVSPRLWSNGNRAGPSRMTRPRHLSCWSGNFPIPCNG
jgi:putative transcriptional regulator